jgi:hypothetical protein
MSEEEVKLDFSEALKLLKRGLVVAREGWNGKGLVLKLQRPDEGSKMTLPYIYIEYPEASEARGNPIYPVGCRCPWLASQSDLLAEDWVLVTE